MANFDYDKIKNMEYDSKREIQKKDGSEFKVTPYSDGSGYKYDYYDKSTYGNATHNSTHVKADLNENWSKTDNNRDKGTQDKSSGSGCYLTTACMKYFQENFDDNCYELTILCWFRDNFVSKEDIKHYYEVAPIIAENSSIIYDYIYNNIVDYCVEQIEQGNYDKAYNRYKGSVLILEEQFAKPFLEQKFTKILKRSLV